MGDIAQRIRPGWLLLVVILLVAGTFSWEIWKKQHKQAEGLVFANGRIEGESMYLGSKLSGRIKTLPVQEGDTIQAGQILATLEDQALLAKLEQAKSTELSAQAQLANVQIQLEILQQQVPLNIARAQAEVERTQEAVQAAKANLHQTKVDAERYSQLAKEGTIDTQKAEQAVLAHTMAKSKLTDANSDRKEAQNMLEDAQLGKLRIKAQQHALEAARDNLKTTQAAVIEAQSYVDDLQITAPANGVIVSRSINLGEIVSAGTPLFEVVDLNQLFLKAYIPERVIGQVHLGQEAQIYLDALVEPIPAKINYIASKAEFTPREVQTVEERTKLVYAVKLQLASNPLQRVVPGLPGDAAIRVEPSAQWQRPKW
ncbi:HlyD family secretion protein [Spartinivicinus ruber]|uniref:HlyD family secretion protein n=1 Tax=Spartinivicinus ruber TaxID=2683272 RepID=UPI0013D770C6|nr:HlyD family efflux transporter periplasmic adaptor subunit [Spartinivicinus ruber]